MIIEALKEKLIPPIPGKLGLSNVASHFIDIQGNEPIRQAPWKYTPKILQTAWAEVDRMLDEGIIEPSDSPWRSCPVLVPKTYDMFRFCIVRLIKRQRLSRIHCVTWMIYLIN